MSSVKKRGEGAQKKRGAHWLPGVQAQSAVGQQTAGDAFDVTGFSDGRMHRIFVAHVVGSVENPMSDAALTETAAELMDGVLPAKQRRALIEACWAIDSQEQPSSLARLAALA